jgi:hypothetical protein
MGKRKFGLGKCYHYKIKLIMNTFLDLIIDYSNSMGGFVINGKSYLLPDGSTRLSLARKALINDIIPSLDYTAFIRIWGFYSNNIKPLEFVPIYEGQFDKDIVTSKINAFNDPVSTGGTPISAALQSSIDFLKTKLNSDKKIILVTDGEEDEGSDFKLTIENGVGNNKIDCNVFIIGIGQNEATAAKCKLLAESTKGGYVNLNTTNYDKEKLSNILRPLSFRAVNSSIANVEESNQEVFTTLVSNIKNVNKESINNNEFSEAVVNILTGHSRSIELINKQLINLEGASMSIEKNLSSIKGEIANILTNSHPQFLVKSIKENNLEILSKIYSKIDQADDNVQNVLKVTNVESGTHFKNLDEKIGILKNEMADIQKVVQLIEIGTSKLLSKRSYENRIIQSLFVVAFITICLLLFIVFRRLL